MVNTSKPVRVASEATAVESCTVVVTVHAIMAMIAAIMRHVASALSLLTSRTARDLQLDAVYSRE